MSLRINSDISSRYAHHNIIRHTRDHGIALERLSSGLRINRASDDPPALAVADMLRAQVLGTGQAMRNANDAISVSQTIDGALQESLNILQTIKTKAIQAAQASQTAESRGYIQGDIDKLLQQLNMIADHTSYNGLKLLGGDFVNQRFQVGDKAGDGVNLSVPSARAETVGKVTTTSLTVAGPGELTLTLHGHLNGELHHLPIVDLAYDNRRENSLGAVADHINAIADRTGLQANAVVELKTNTPIKAGNIDDLQINGISIGSLQTQANDANGALVKTINDKRNQTGVTASVDHGGRLQLTSDGRAIEVTGDIEEILGQAAPFRTFGTVELIGAGRAETRVTGEVPQAKVEHETTYNAAFPSSARAAFEFALDKWSEYLSFPVPLQVKADFEDLPLGVLGSANPVVFNANQFDSPVADTWYTAANANAIAGSDLDPTAPEVVVNFSSEIDWYYGTDGQAGPGQYDFVSVAMHEIGHALGFLSLASDDGTFSGQQLPAYFDRLISTDDGTNFADLTEAEREDAVLGVGTSLWINGSMVDLIYTPPAWAGGSSVSHLDEQAFPPGHPDSLMTPQLGAGEAMHGIGPATEAIFADLGWTLSSEGGEGVGVSLGDVVRHDLMSINVTSYADAQRAITIVETAFGDLQRTRNIVGSAQNRMTDIINNLSLVRLNANTAESELRDSDFANEVAQFQKMEILRQAATFAMSQTKVQNESVLKLLQG